MEVDAQRKMEYPQEDYAKHMIAKWGRYLRDSKVEMNKKDVLRQIMVFPYYHKDLVANEKFFLLFFDNFYFQYACKA